MRCLTDHGRLVSALSRAVSWFVSMSSVVAVAHPLVDQLGGEPEVGQITQRRRAVMEHVADGINGVVRHGERLDCHVLDLEIVARGGTGASWDAFAQAFALAAERFGGERVAINGQARRAGGRALPGRWRGRRVRA